VQPRARRSIRLSLALLAAAATLSAGASLAGATATSRTTSSVKVLDIGQVRLHVPGSWVITVARKVCGHRTCRRQCAPGYAKRVYVSTFPPLLNCPLNFRRNSVWVVPTARKGATTRRRLAFDAGSEILTIPSKGVTLYGFGKPGVHVVATEEPSSLARLLAAHLPVAVPSGWQSVSDGVVSMEVPARWPVRHLAGPNDINPGACGGPFFPNPAASVGVGTAIVFCADNTSSTDAASLAAPGNGAWLVGASNAVHLPVVFSPPGTTTRSRTIHRLHATIRFALAPNGTNAVLVTVVAGGVPHYLVLGLGLAPTIAGEILSSLRAS
jgi:hypothetical protein